MRSRLDNKQRTSIIDLLFAAVCCCNMGIFLFGSDLFGNEGLLSLSARIYILLDIIILACILLRPFDKNQKRQLITMALMAFFAVITYILKPSGSLFDFVITLIGYIAVPIYALAVQKVSFCNGMIYLLRVVSVIYALFFIYRGYITPTFRPGSDALMLGYINPNITGAYMFLVCILLLVAFNNVEKKIWRYMSYALVVLVLYPILLTQCRSALLLTSACLVYAVFPRIYRPKKLFPVVCTVFPWAFYYLYLYLYRVGWNLDMELLDKTIYSGRQETFVNEKIIYTLFGNFDKNFGGLNSAVGVINTLGLIGFVLFVVFYVSFLTAPLMQNYKGKRVEKRNLPLFCMGALMLHGCVESAMFTAGTVYAGMVGCILVAIACNNRENHFRKKSRLL